MIGDWPTSSDTVFRVWSYSSHCCLVHEGRRTHTAVGVTEAAPATRYRALNGCYQIYRGRLATPTVETKRPVAHACYRAHNAS